MTASPDLPAQIAALLAKLGNSDRAARDLIDLSEAALPAVDALASDETQRAEARRAASLVAHQIRTRALRAPPAPVAPPASGEARAALASGATFGGDGLHARHDAGDFVEQLYASGAVRVEIVERGTLLVTLPDDAVARARLFDIYNAEVDELGEEFGGEEGSGHAMTADEARAIGAPEAEGEWVLDDLHIGDTGQRTLRFCWD